MRIIHKILIVVFFLVAGKTYAQDLIYTPKNPAFGGSPYNYSWLLSSAEAQNTTEKTSSGTYTSSTSDPLDDFTESLNRQILSQLSREIVSRQFGEDALSEGVYILGDYQIEIGDQSDGLNITIVDNATGSQTTVMMPYF